ncbi:MAG: HugZ family protein [Halarcobacter sp.]
MLNDFLKNFKSVVISSKDEDNLPFTSYAPFIKDDFKYYVYISAIAKHTQNLDLHQKASLFFIEDEKECENIFARKRVVLQSTSKKLERDNDEFERLMDLFKQKHGSTIDTLKQMKDFSIYEFTPLKGEAVFGFGKAYDVGGKNCEELLERKNIKGHQK